LTPDESEDAVGRALSRWVAFCLAHGSAVVATMLALTVAASVLAYSTLGFNVDPNALFSEDLRFQQMIAEFEEHFPQLTDSFLVVVDAPTPESARQASEALARALGERREHFTAVYFPGEEEFFEANGLLYQSVDDLDLFAERLAQLQPVLARLSRDPSLTSLSWVVKNSLERAPEDEEAVAQLRSVLDHFRQATLEVYAEFPVRVSWETVLLGGTPFDPSTRRVIVADPVLHFGRVLAAGPALDAVRAAVSELGLEAQGVEVRVTGYAALNHEEFVGLARDTQLAGMLSFLLVVCVIAVAFRSKSMVAAAAITLFSGFAWTAEYAALFVHELNPASIAFAVLFIGLGVDFMIHLGMHVTSALRAGEEVDQALISATETTGAALVLCAVTTAIGFLAFLPTDYRGVSELGVISAGGMLVIVVQTLTLFPVLVHAFVGPKTLARMRSQPEQRVPLLTLTRPGLVCGVAVALALFGALFASRARVETNVIALRNPATESVETFKDLIQSDRITPWYLDMLAPDIDTAVAWAAAARNLDVVNAAVTVRDYVPEEQDEKLEILEDAALFLELPERQEQAPLPVAEQIATLRALVDFLTSSEALDTAPSDLAESGRRLRDQLADFIARIDTEEDPGPVLASLEDSLLGTVPQLTERLRESLETTGVEFEDLPPGLVTRMLDDDGTARVQVFPAEDLSSRAAMVGFVEELRGVTPRITGLPVNLVESSYATMDSLRKALVWAFAAIALLLVVLWGRPIEAAIALAPLVVAVLLTAAASELLRIHLNFINVCVLPLLLGIGVDSGVHMVHRARTVDVASGALLGSTTTRAVLFSAFTTLASFGTLVLSLHQGIASLGQLLMVGMVFTLAGNLVLLPSLLLLWQRGRA
jgi:hopanoid biosynthesis associated RND transporter like protein HpnN